MKTTLDIPDAMYRAVKSRSAGEGLSVRHVTIMLYGDWLATPSWKPRSSSVSDIITTPTPPPTRRLGCFGVAAKYARKDVSHEMDDIRASILSGHKRDLAEVARVLETPRLGHANPGFVDRLIAAGYAANGETTLSCEKSFSRFYKAEVIRG